VVAELAAEFRSEQDYLGECNKNRLLAAVAHAAIRRRSAQGIRAWMSRSGDSIQRRNGWWNKLQFLFDLLRYKRSAPKQGMVGASNLLGVGAEKSSLYRLGFLGFDAYLIKYKRKV
jgi:hypothetical protein